MSDFDEIQRLIRLKRHEQPPEDFVEDFVRSFQQRQRAELLQQSARGLLWERMTTYLDGLMSPKWGWAAATAVAVAVSWFGLQPDGQSLNGGLAQQSSAGNEASTVIYDGAMSMPITEQEAREYLLSRHYDGIFVGEDDQKQDTQPQFASPIIPQHGDLLPIGFKLEVP